MSVSTCPEQKCYDPGDSRSIRRAPSNINERLRTCVVSLTPYQEPIKNISSKFQLQSIDFATMQNIQEINIKTIWRQKTSNLGQKCKHFKKDFMH